MFLISRYLKCIKNDVAAGQGLLSDALIASLKIIRTMVVEECSTFFNRELLGYRDDEASSFEASIRPAKSKRQAVADFRPVHRMIDGYWVSLTGTDWQQVPRSLDNRIESIFYPHGVCELEEVLARVTISDATWISVAFDEKENRVFMSRTSDLNKLLDRCSKTFCKHVEMITKELRLPTIPSRLSLREITYGLKAQTRT
ncbi:unnamed protein product [Sphagnum balticum]